MGSSFADAGFAGSGFAGSGFDGAFSDGSALGRLLVAAAASSFEFRVMSAEAVGIAVSDGDGLGDVGAVSDA